MTGTARTSAPGADDLHDRVILRIWLRLLSCGNIIEGRVRTLLRERFETTLPRFDVLAQLAAASPPGLTMSELSRRLMVTNGNLTGLVDRLERERLVTRVVSPRDRRTQIVRLSARGQRALDAIIPDHLAWVSAMFSGLSDGERTQLYTLLGKLKSSAQHADLPESIRT